MKGIPGAWLAAGTGRLLTGARLGALETWLLPALARRLGVPVQPVSK